MSRESGYYPPGAEFDPRAPYNQEEYSEECSDDRCEECTSYASGECDCDCHKDVPDPAWERERHER